MRVKLPEIEIFKLVAHASDELKLKTFVVGGFVRDLILKRESKDIDFVCVGNGLELAKKVAELSNSKDVKYFKNFGTAMIHFEEYDIEFVGARKESYRSDSRKPIVENGTFLDDQHRRDFTINTLAISLNNDNFGELIDSFGGLNDLKNKIIKTPLDANITFIDDPLRMMRAIRFATQLNFDIEAVTFEAISKNADRISIISKERIIDELNKIILSKTPSYGFKLLFSSGLLKIIFPKMYELHGVDVIDNKSHKDNFYHTLKVLDNISATTNNLWLRWAAILHDIAKPDTKRFSRNIGWTFHGHEHLGAKMVPKIFNDLKLPLNEKMRYVQKLVRLHLRPIALVKKEVTDSAVRRLLFEAGNDIEDLMLLCRADITSKDTNRVNQYLKNFDLVEKKLVEVELQDKIRNFSPIIKGEHIMKTFGIKPSKVIGVLKDAITDAILDGKIKNEFHSAYNFLLKESEKHNLIVKNHLTPEDIQ